MIRSEERSGLVFTIAGGASLLLLCLYLLGFFHEPAAAPAGPAHAAPRRRGSVAGEIVDAKSGHVVADPTVEVLGLDGVSDHWLVPPDPDQPRRFEMKGLPIDRAFTLEIGAAGHVSVRRETRVAAGATTELGEIRLVPLVTIAGNVVDANGQPIADAEVMVESEEAKAPATIRADAHGGFRLEGLAPATWRVRARTSAGERCDEPSAVDAHGGGAAEPVTIEVFPTFAVRGTVGVSVDRPAPSDVRVGERSARVASDGSFVLGDLFAGSQRLSFRFGDGWRRSAPIGVPADAIALDANELEAATVLEPERHFGRSGAGEDDRGGPCAFVVRVVDEAGRPLPGAFVELTWSDAANVTRATARNGETTFRGLRSGGAQGLLARHGRRRSWNERTIAIAESASAAPFELRCAPAEALVVKVVGPDGVAVRGARVAVVTPRLERPTDDAGVARFAELPPPPWALEVAGGDAFESWSSPSVTRDADGTVTVRLTAKSDGR